MGEKQLWRHQGQRKRRAGSAPGARTESPAAHNADHGELDYPPAAHGGPW